MSTTADAHDDVPAWVLTVLAAMGQAIAVAIIIAIGSRGSGGSDTGAYLFAAGFGALLLVRRRFPVAVLVTAVIGVFVYYVADYPPIGMAVPVVGAFYGAAERGRVVVATVAGTVLLAVSLYFRINDAEPSTVLAYDVITNAALIGCAIALALTVRSRRAQRRQQERMLSLERRYQQEQAAGQREAERLQIARDIHDSVGHALSLVSVQARVAQQALGEDDSTVARALDSVVAATGSSLTDLRRTLAMLQTDRDAAGHAPLTLAGVEQTAQAARDAGLDVDLVIDVGSAVVPAPTASTAFRIVQESVTNALRHAGATGIGIIVRVMEDDLHLRITDDGEGADPRVPIGGQGIAGMRERAALVGGTVTVSSGASGFTVDATLPMRGTV